MPRNAMTVGQANWLRAWQQRQQNKNPGWDASRMPKAGWRGRYNQRTALALEREAKEKESAYGPAARVPQPWTPPPPPRPLGFRTLAPAGVPAGGWGGGAIEHETALAPATPSLGWEPANPNPPPGMEVIGGSGHNWIYGPKRPQKPGFSPGMPVMPSQQRPNAMMEY